MAALSVFAETSAAAWPGANGRIFFGAWISCCDTLYSTNLDGTDVQRVYQGRTELNSVSLSPDGTQFVATGSSHAGGALVIAPTTYEAGPEYSVAEPIFDPDFARGRLLDGPVWAPDNSRVLFTAKGSLGSKAGVWMANRDGTDVTQIVARTDVLDASAEWSPDMTKISFMVGSTTYSVKADGSGPLTIIASSYPRLNDRPSPNGALTAFTVPGDTGKTGGDIYISDLGGGHTTRVTTLGWVYGYDFSDCNPLSTSPCPYIVDWQAIPDHAAPLCELTAQIPGPPKQLKITVQDTGAGISTITHGQTNASVSVPAFAAGMTDAFTITATKTNQAKPSTVALTVTDAVGNVTTCDPVWPAAKKHRAGAIRSEMP